MYSLVNENSELNKKTGKGISRRALEKNIHHQQYLDCLEDDYKVQQISMKKIHSEKHRIYTVVQRKKGISPYNDKIFISKCDDGSFETHSFGYKE